MRERLKVVIVSFCLGFGLFGLIINIVLYNQMKHHVILWIDGTVVLIGLIMMLVPTDWSK